MPSSSFYNGLRICTSVAFLTLIIITVPIAFDVGGRDCGLAFSLSLATFYILLSIIRLSISIRRSRFAWVVYLAGALQYIIVPALLIASLDRFSGEDGQQEVVVESTTDRIKRAMGYRVDEHVLPVGGLHPSLVDRLTIVPWYSFLTIFSPIFQLVEGFCTLLVIQAVGQISKWLVNTKKSDTWMILQLVTSGTIISWAVYFLWRIYSFPAIDNIDATLIGVTITCAVMLCGYGIGSGRGNPIESSLLFSYVVLCMYQIFTDYKPNNPVPESQKPDFPPLPPIIMSSFTAVTTTLVHTLPFAITSSFKFLRAVISTVTPSVLISLAYRLFVLAASTKIIPAIREGRSLSIDDGRGSGRRDGIGMRILKGFSPVAIIAVYTNLLMMHFATMGGGVGVGEAAGGMEGMSWLALLVWTPAGAQIWRWVNLFGTMALYAFEIIWGQENGDHGSSLTSQWKTD